MLNASAKLWRARLAITAGILIISTSAVIIGHHRAWMGDQFYQASLRDDSYFALAALIAFGVAAVGAFSRPYFLTVNCVFIYLATLNVKTLFAGEFMLVGDHGCMVCIDGAMIFANDMPTYVVAGLLAATVTGLIADRLGSPPARARRSRLHLAVAAVLVLALVASEIEFLYAAQIPYLVARLLRLLPYVAAAIIGVILATIIARRSPQPEAPTRFLRTRLTLAGLLVSFVLLVNVLNTLRG